MYLVSLSLLLTLGAGIAVLASAHVASSAVTSSASADRALGEALLAQLGPSTLADTRTAAARERQQNVLERAVEDVGVLGIALATADGDVRVSAGLAFDPRSGGSQILAGEATAQLVDTGDGAMLHESFPVTRDGSVEAVLHLIRDGTPIVAAAERAQRDIALGVAGGVTVLVVVLFLVFRGTQRRLDDQVQQLLEATRRDPLTGLLTHGAVVEFLAEAMAGIETTPVAVAMLDIDNFHRLNETHGHDLGDDVVRTIARVLHGGDPAARVVGRSGPDEFLVVAPGLDAQALAREIEVACDELGARGIAIERADDLPLTLSVGIAVAPLHARAAGDLLSAASVTLAEAKGGGGDQVLIARLSHAELVREQRASFSILDGLVNAIDTRDRYTWRHSQDVARYALFLAHHIGLDRAETRAVLQAALLHDVGKIAIPDSILRKPGVLTTEEGEAMKQHVLLGGILVRDLEGADDIVNGVRHHHERWDGDGYPDGLESEAIPLIARIIAIADAYSAMTTSRPYRRALSPEVALQRIARAAGSQLDPRLADVFVLAMEASPNPPIPSDDRRPSAWLDGSREEDAA